ncbi:MAG: phosphoribosyltransferase [Gaiellales bacterium]|jgi:ATP phosphoribosyltransferase|nr:phosphoribosyltransferase [Gaiellales bacterium]
MTRPFRLALPSKGRMHAPAVELARDAGIEVEMNGRALYSHCSQWDIEVLFARSDDIPTWASDGAVETAIAGRNQLVEAGSAALEILPLGFGRCRLELAVAGDSPVQAAADLAGRRVATAYPATTRDFFGRAGIEVQVVAIHGSVELAPRLDAAEAICDLVSSGETLRSNGLRVVETVLESEAVLLARPGLDAGQQAIAQSLATVMESVIAARGKRYLMLNSPDRSLERVIDLLPGLESPTVLPLARTGMHAVHAVVDRRQVVELLGPLRAAGASSILVLPIENLVP